MLLKISKQFTKHTVQNLFFPAREEKQPTACLPASAWARGPATNGRAAETARALRPPGPKLARKLSAAAGRPSRWTAERAPRPNKTGCDRTPCNPSSIFLLSPETLVQRSQRRRGSAARGRRARRRR
jgi:hypothetical protein